MCIARVGIIIAALSAQGLPAKALKSPSWIQAVKSGERPAHAPVVEVWDGTFDHEELRRLRPFTSSLQGQHLCFPLGTPSTTVERALQSVLDELEPPAPPDPAATVTGDVFVEYWTRNTFQNIDAHRDIDELLLHDEICSEPRCPLVGHVLYLAVDCQGPTIVFEDARDGPSRALRSASAALRAAAGRSQQSPQEEEPPPASSPSLPLSPTFRSMHVVPALTARLLRFRGDAMHSVPRPANRYLAGATAAASEDRPEQREVILFNLWLESPPHRIAVAEGDNTASSTLRCAPRSDWSVAVSKQHSADPPDARSAQLSVGLLGPPARRGYDAASFVAMAPQEAAAEALASSHCPSEVLLSTETNRKIQLGELAAAAFGLLS